MGIIPWSGLPPGPECDGGDSCWELAIVAPKVSSFPAGLQDLLLFRFPKPLCYDPASYWMLSRHPLTGKCAPRCSTAAAATRVLSPVPLSPLRLRTFPFLRTSRYPSLSTIDSLPSSHVLLCYVIMLILSIRITTGRPLEVVPPAALLDSPPYSLLMRPGWASSILRNPLYPPLKVETESPFSKFKTNVLEPLNPAAASADTGAAGLHFCRLPRSAVTHTPECEIQHCTHQRRDFRSSYSPLPTAG